MKHLTQLLTACLLAMSCIVHTHAQCNEIFVSPSGSGTGNTASSPTNLTNALTLASSGRAHIKLLGGTYNLTATLNIPHYDNLDGGYTTSGSEWIKSSNVTTTLNINPTVIDNSSLNIAYFVGISAIGASNFRLQDLTINVLAAGATGTSYSRGRSVYAVYLNGVSNYAIARCNITAGAASSGIIGTAGTAGASGTNGAVGGNGNCNTNGNGGTGGTGGTGGGGAAGGTGNTNAAGSAGTAASGRNGGGGGAGGAGGQTNCNSGRSGGNGGAGGGGAGSTSVGTGGSCGDPGNDGTTGGTGTAGATGAAGTTGVFSYGGGFAIASRARHACVGNLRY